MSNLILLFHSIQVIHCSTNLVLTYHQRNHWNWHQSCETHGNKKKSNPMFHVNAIIINHTKHTAIKNSETMLISQFRGQKPAFNQNVINSIRLYSLPSMEGEGQHMVWLRAPLFDVRLTGEVLVTLHRKLRCTRRLLDTMERNGTHGFRTTPLSTSSLRGSPFLGWQVWP